MTELLSGPVEVRQDQAGALQAVHLSRGWRVVERIANQWLVDTDWWRTPVRRHYVRLLLRDGECLELYRDLDEATWHLVRRYD